MAVKVQSTIEPYNNSYFVANAKNIGVGDPGAETPLNEVLQDLPSGGSDITVDIELSLESENPVQNKAVTQEFKAFNDAVGEINRRVSSLESGGVGGSAEYEIPTFDLVAMGLPAIVYGGAEGAALETDATEIVTALKEGAVKFIVAADMGGEVANVEVVMNGIIMPDGSVICSYLYSVVGASITLIFAPDMIGGIFMPLAGGDSSGGGVSSWNDLTDKPFGENEDGTVKQLDNKYLEPFDGIDAEELLPSYTGTTVASDLGIYALMIPAVEGMFDRWHGNGDNTITGNIFVEFDGVTYECAQQRLTALDDGMAVGNCASFGGTGNNEPFLLSIVSAEGANYWAVGALTDTASTEHTARVYQPFDEPKYMLKEECLPFDAIAAYIDNYIDEALGGDY